MIEKLGWLTAGLAYLVLTTGLARGQPQIVLTDYQSYERGRYDGFVAPWGAGSYLRGVNYDWSETIQPGSWPNNTLFAWSWPPKPCAAVCGDIHIAYGNYNAGSAKGVVPKKISAISSLIASANLIWSGTSSGYDTIYDIFLTTSAGDSTTNHFEIEIFLHSPQNAQDYLSSVTQIGTYTDPSSRAWKVAVDTTLAAHDFLFMPTDNSDVPNSPIDMKAMLNWLTTKGYFTGNEYYNGHCLAVEPRQFSGTLTVNSFSVTYN